VTSSLVPPTLPVFEQLGAVPAARPWLAALPRLVAEVARQFELTLSPPLHGGSCSWVAPAELPDGTPVVVKIGWPHPEMYGEPAALRLWNGHGAVRLLGHDPRRHALILQRCVPGGELGDAPLPDRERLRLACAVLRRLWEARVPDGGPDALDDLGAVTAGWADLLEERMSRLRPGYDPGLVELGARLLRELPASAGRRVVLHGDFNPGNVLSAGGGWLAIDPKPMTGDPAYDPWPLLEQIGDPFRLPAAALRDRVTLVAGELGCDADRIVLWSVARRVEAALWAADHGDVPGGAGDMAQARVWAALQG
jgi:streptomycin 6-kinase